MLDGVSNCDHKYAFLEENSELITLLTPLLGPYPSQPHHQRDPRDAHVVDGGLDDDDGTIEEVCRT